jgi:hypothetical protein
MADGRGRSYWICVRGKEFPLPGEYTSMIGENLQSDVLQREGFSMVGIGNAIRIVRPVEGGLVNHGSCQAATESL